jgi:hypothetical protein
MVDVPQRGPWDSARPEDYIRVLRIREPLYGNAIGYEADDALLPRLTKGNDVIVPSRSYPLSLVTVPVDGDPTDLEEIEFNGTTPTEVVKVKQGKANAHVHRLKRSVDGFTDVPILMHFDGFGPGERWWEKFNQPDMFIHNPTFQGQMDDVGGLTPPPPADPTYETPDGFWPSPQYYRNITATYVEGAAIPLTFDRDGHIEGPGYNHGCDANHGALFWDMPQFQRYEPMVGGRGRVDRITHWFYQRRAWSGNEWPGKEFYCNAAAGASIVERPIADAYDTIEIIDVDTQTILDKTEDLADFGRPGAALTFTANAFHLYKNGVELPGGPPFSEGRGCIAMTDSATGWCVAVIAKIYDDPAGCTQPNIFAVQLMRWVDQLGYPPGTELLNFGNIVNFQSQDTRRVAGWVGHSYLLYAGHRDNLLDALTEIESSGILDEDPADVPVAARLNTEWPPGTDPGTILVDAFEDSELVGRHNMTKTITQLSGVHEGAVAPGCGTGARSHKALLRSTQTRIVNARPVGGASSAAVATYTSLTVASGRMNPPSTLVAHVSQTSAATGTLKLRVRGWDQFGEKIVEETPTVAIVNKTNNYVYLSKVFAFVTSVEFQSTGLDIADDTISLGTRWDWTRTVDASNAHTAGLNLGWGVPMRLGARPNVAVTGRHKRDTRPAAIPAWGTLTLLDIPSNAETWTVDGKVYTFKTTITAANGDVLIGATVLETLTNLYLAINLMGTAGVHYGTGTTIHATVRVNTPPTVDAIVVTAKTPGVLGNLLAMSTTLTVGAYELSGSYLEGGESDTGEVLRVNVRDVSGRSSSAARPFVTSADGRRILLGYAESGWEGANEKVSILKQDAAEQWGGTAAIQDLTIQTNPGNGHTVTIDSKVYTFETSLTNVDGNVLIGASAAASLENLRRAINLMSGAGTNYAAATTLHATVFAFPVRPGSGLSGVLRVQAKTVGTGGNSLAVSETLSGTGNAWGDTDLAGGAADLVDVMVESYIRTAALPFQSR